MTRTACIAAATAALDDGHLFHDLQRRVAMRTESDAGAPPEQALAPYLHDEMVPALEALGFDCTVLPNPEPGGGPFLVARRIEDAALPTVLGYGHGDVVSGQDAQWQHGLAPFALAAVGDRWYGRGTADNKGQHSINIAALAAVIGVREGGRLGYNVTLLLEMGEEAASPGLRAVCEQYRDTLLRADLFLASDGPRVSAARPTLFLGSRGAVNFTLRLKSRERGYHSGNWGGVLTNPATVLAHAVATLADRHGRLTVAGLRPPPISAAVRRVLADLPVGQDEGDPEIAAHWGEPGLSPAERLMAWNTLEVLALGAGNPQRPVNAIPPEAVAHCQLRFVVGTPWQDLDSIVREHLDVHGFPEIEVAITLAGGATRLDVEHPWVGWAAQSIEDTCGRPPAILPNLAGSLPNELFADVLGLPTLWVPHSYPGCAQHAPHEHLLVPVVREGLQTMAGLYWDLGAPQGLPWHADAASAASADSAQSAPSAVSAGPVSFAPLSDAQMPAAAAPSLS